MTSMKFGALGIALALGSAAVAVSITAATAREAPTQVHLLAQNSSGEAGTATLLQGERGLIVRLRLSNTTAPLQPAHIHKGTCAKLDPKPAYPLNAVREGFSETTIEGVNLSDLQKGTYAINVHKSTTEIPIYVSCGNLAAK